MSRALVRLGAALVVALLLYLSRDPAILVLVLAVLGVAWAANKTKE